MHAGSEHVAPDTLMVVVRRDDLAGLKRDADLRSDDADLADRDPDGRNDLHVMQHRIEEMPPLGKHLFPDALLSAFDQQLAGFGVGAGFGGDDRHVTRRHVEPAEEPEISAPPQNGQGENGDQSENDAFFHVIFDILLGV